MAAYDFFSNFYDASLEKVYAKQRLLATQALLLQPDSVVLDVPCGTGQSFDAIAPALGEHGALIGVDTSQGMLRRAQARIEQSGLRQVHLLHADAATIDLALLETAVGRTVAVTHLHVFLGMSVFSDMEHTFERLWELLQPGGRCVLVDVHAPVLGLQGRLVNRIAGADIRRRFWEPLERVALSFRRHDLPYARPHGGQIMLAQGIKP